MKQDLANRILYAATTRLGEEVTIVRGSTTRTVYGIFSENFSDVDVDTGLRVTTEQPSLTISADELDIEPVGNDRVTVADGREFIVREVRQDGEGGLILLMYQASANNYL